MDNTTLQKSQPKSDYWFTPPVIFGALGETFDLDVAAPPEGPRHVPARRYFSKLSLERRWNGFVWMNPPYGHQSSKRLWLGKFFRHGNGIALMPDRTSAPWWQEFAPMAHCLLFISPKIQFERPDGSVGEQPGNGTTLFAAGPRAVDALVRATSLGCVFWPDRIAEELSDDEKDIRRAIALLV